MCLRAPASASRQHAAAGFVSASHWGKTEKVDFHLMPSDAAVTCAA